MKKLFFLILLISFGLSSEEIRLLLDPIKKEAGDQSLNWIGSDMSDSISASLTRLNGIRILSTEDRKKVDREIGDYQKRRGVEEVDGKTVDPYADYQKANVILKGIYIVQGGNLNVNIRLVNVKTLESKAVRVSEKYSNDTLNDTYEKIIYKIIAELEKPISDDIDSLVLSDEDRAKIKIKRRYNPKAVEMYYNGRQVFFTNPNKAIENFKAAIALEPNYAEALTQLGYALFYHKKEVDKALIEFQKAEKIFAEVAETESFSYAELLTLKAGAYYSAKKFTEALSYYEKAEDTLTKINMTDSASMAYIEYGSAVSSSGLGKIEDSLSHFERSKTLFENYSMEKTAGYANVLYGMAYAQLSKNDLDSSLENYKKSFSIYQEKGMEKNITSAGILYSIAYILEKKQDKPEAGKYYRKAYLIYESIGYTGKEKETVKKGAERNEK